MAQTQHTLPPGFVVVQVAGEAPVIMYVVDGVRIYFDLSAPGAMEATNMAGAYTMVSMSREEFYGQDALVHGGMVQEVWDVPDFFGFINEQLSIAFVNRPDLEQSPEIRQILMRWIVNPELSEDEILADITATDFYQNTTEATRNWATMTDAEQRHEVNRQLYEILGPKWLEVVGTSPDLASPELTYWATLIANGTKTFGQFIEDYLKPLAMQNPESPWARQGRTEQEAQLQRGNEIENTRTDVRALYTQWGIPVSEQTINDRARAIVEGRSSAEDLIEDLKDQAQVLYPWKPRETATTTAAEPYIQQWARLMERPPPDLFHPQIQQALNSGISLWEQEQQIKGGDDWLWTNNAEADLSQRFMRVGQILGFE